MRTALLACALALAALALWTFWDPTPRRQTARRDAPAEPPVEKAPRVEVDEPGWDPLRPHVSGRVVDEVYRPVAGATVRLADGSETTSGPDGSFVLAGGDATLEVAADGYAPVRHSFVRSDGILVVLERGESVAVRVIDSETDAPLARARVRIGRMGARVAAVSGADGIARFHHVPTRVRNPREMAEIIVERPGYAPHQSWYTEPRYVPDIRLVASPSVSGVVRHKQTGLPVAGATVRWLVGKNPFDLPTATTAADGTFALSGAPLGTRRWTAEHPTLAADPIAVGEPILMYEPTLARGVVHDPDGKPVAGATVFAWHGRGARTKTDADGSFRIAWDEFYIASHPEFTNSDQVKAAEEGMVLRLRPGATVTGRCVDEAGRPVPRVLVTVHPANRHTVTDARGRFTLRTKIGPAMFTSEHPDLLGQWTQHYLEGDHDLGDIVLQRGGEISGVVVDGEGRPVPGVEVMNAISRLDGSFVIRPLEPGRTYNLKATRPGLFSRVVRAETGATEVHLVVQPAGTIRARVTAGDEPVEGVEVEAHGRTTKTDTQGRFVLLMLAPGDPVDVQLRHDDYTYKTLVLWPGEAVQEITLER